MIVGNGGNQGIYGELKTYREDNDCLLSFAVGHDDNWYRQMMVGR